jgi:hypothetical protein
MDAKNKSKEGRKAEAPSVYHSLRRYIARIQLIYGLILFFPASALDLIDLRSPLKDLASLTVSMSPPLSAAQAAGEVKGWFSSMGRRSSNCSAPRTISRTRACSLLVNFGIAIVQEEASVGSGTLRCRVEGTYSKCTYGSKDAGDAHHLGGPQVPWCRSLCASASTSVLSSDSLLPRRRASTPALLLRHPLPSSSDMALPALASTTMLVQENGRALAVAHDVLTSKGGVGGEELRAPDTAAVGGSAGTQLVGVALKAGK